MKVCFTHVTSSGWPGLIFRQNLQNTNLLSTKLIFLFAKMSRLRYLLDLLEGKRSLFDYLQPGHSPQGEELRGRGVLRLADGGGEDEGREGEVHLVKPWRKNMCVM